MICLPTKNILFPNHCAIITLNIRWVLTCNKCRVLSMSYAKCSYTIHITCCGKYFEPLFCIVYRIEKKNAKPDSVVLEYTFFFSLVRMDCCNGKLYPYEMIHFVFVSKKIGAYISWNWCWFDSFGLRKRVSVYCHRQGNGKRAQMQNKCKISNLIFGTLGCKLDESET